MTTEPNVVLVTGVAVLAALTTSCASPVAKTGPAPAAVIGEAADGGNAPVAMPVRLPDSYEFGGAAGVNHRQGKPVATAWTFESVAESNAVPVVVCVRGKDASAETCPAGHPRTGDERATSRYLVSVSSGDRARPELPEEWADREVHRGVAGPVVGVRCTEGLTRGAGPAGSGSAPTPRPRTSTASWTARGTRPSPSACGW